MERINELVKEFTLEKHPEGGYFKETYRSDETLDFDNFNGKRNLSTAIYFLLTENNFSAFHKIKSDELWHFYEGDSLLVHCIYPNGNYVCKKLGLNIEEGESPQQLVEAGVWFASEVREGGKYSFVGCTVAPGFDFEDFVLADSQLLENFERHSGIISRLLKQ